MVLNYIWISFFLIAFIVALYKVIFLGDYTVFATIMNGIEIPNSGGKTEGGLFNTAKDAFTLALNLTGLLTFWLGIMKIGEAAGIVRIFAKLIGPFFEKIFPEIPRDHPVMGNIMLNYSANMLGLDNAATPIGLKAMQGLQELNPNKEVASNAQIMFLVLNTAGLTIIPISIMAVRAQFYPKDPTDIFLPLLLASFSATIAALIAMAIVQRINIFNKVVLAYMGGFIALLGFIIYYFQTNPAQMRAISSFASNFIMFSVIVSFIALGLYKKINVFDSFIEGAKEGFDVAIKIIPFLVGILVAVSVFRYSGAFGMIMDGLAWVITGLGFDTSFIPSLPTALMKPFTSGGARAMMVDTIMKEGVDSFPAKLSAIFQGSSDTTFYILAVYFGSVGIKKTRYAAGMGLLADFFSIISSILMAYLFFK